MSRTISRPGATATRISFVAGPVVGLAVAVLLVWQASYAAFSSQTTSPGNNWSTGSVQLGSSPAGAMFNAGGLVPGSTDKRCIAVTSTGSVASTVKLYGSGLSTTKALSSYLDIDVQQGTGAAASGSCSDFAALGSGASVFTGTLAGFTATDFASGYGSWAPTGTGSETRTFQITYTLRSTAPQSTAGGTAGITFVWEAQS